MLNPSIIKKTVYGLAVVCGTVVIFLAFLRETPGLTASQRNASFLEIKHSEAQKTDDKKADTSKSNESETKKEDNSTTKPDESKKADDKTSETNKNGGTVSPGEDKAAGFYTVKEGDTYGCIAEKYYGSYEHWVDVLNANIKYGQGFEERRLFVDAKLEMPAISKSNLKPSTKLCQ